MQISTQFQVYNASAGSGKTFTLVKEYLKILLDTDDIFRFQNILAITFTNKAAAEMKERVLESLRNFSEGNQGDLFDKIKEECNLSEDKIQHRSKRVLNSILQNYSAFNITTIDSFTHRIVRSFAFDLGLSLNFEVEMDAKSILDEAVDLLISKIGINKQLTKTLIDFSLDKADDDKAWDIANDLKEFAKILLNENDVFELKKLETKTIQDFTNLKKHLKKEQEFLKLRFKEIGEKALQIIEENNLSEGVYKGSYFPNHFKNLRDDFLKANFFDGSKLKFNIENNNIHNKSAEKYSDVLQSVEPELFQLYYQSEKIYQQYLLNSLVLKGLIPLAVLKHINSSLNEIKEQNNIRLNAEFNQLISDQIKNEPAPFIYERIGEKFRYYFIDEMQDTSQLQWQNLIPLIENALISETIGKERGSLMLVGDAKQAIYRWRGGKAEQFINLANKENPFSIEKISENLDTNFRSYSEIIDFNNQFFTHIAGFLGNKGYKDLYLIGNQQKKNKREGGYVEISFIEKTKDKEKDELLFPEKVLEIINKIDSNFEPRDICVLVRKRKEGVAIAKYLTEHKIAIVSSETLLLKNNSNVAFIIDLLAFIQNPDYKESLANALYFLGQKDFKEDIHSFIQKYINQTSSEIFNSLSEHQYFFTKKEFVKLPLYDAVEYLIRSFKLIQDSDAFIQAFLDVILEFQNSKGSNLSGFLEFWERKKDSLSISISENQNAVKIMTIHKSKGLEFPIVIYPYDLEIYREMNPKIWYENLDKEKYLDFEISLVDYSKKLKHTSDYGTKLFENRRKEVQLDNLNLLYVALTRPIEQLYIVTEKKKSPNSLIEAKWNSDFFVDFLENHPNNSLSGLQEDLYAFGDSKRVSKIDDSSKSTTVYQEKFISSAKEEHNIIIVVNSSLLWDTEQEKAIKFGNLIHEIFSKINTLTDVDESIIQYINEGIIDTEVGLHIKDKIERVITHKKLKEYYQPNLQILNEQEIVTIDKLTQIPDRIVIKGKVATILDYKTGKPHKKHHNQINAYAKTMSDLGYEVDKKIVIYLSEDILFEEIN